MGKDNKPTRLDEVERQSYVNHIMMMTFLDVLIKHGLTNKDEFTELVNAKNDLIVDAYKEQTNGQ